MSSTEQRPPRAVPTTSLTSIVSHIQPLVCNTSPFFQHEPLELDQDVIRLVCVLPYREQANVIECSVDTVPLANRYVCLSYTWGTGRSEHLIRLNGKLFAVKSNLWTFLDHAQRFSIQEPLWIDALCINQNCTEEKNHQVGRMAAIYRRAQCVLVWLGTSWSYLVSRLENKQQLLTALYTSEPVSFKDYKCPMAVAYDNILYKIAQSEYWTRTWIIQEVLLPQGRVYLILDKIKVPLQTFSRELLSHTSLKRIPRQSETKFGRFIRLLDSVEYTNVADLFRLTGQSCCKDPRDRVYALRGMCETLEGLKVDYSVSITELAVRVVQHLAPQDLGTLVRTVLALGKALELACLPRFSPALAGDRGRRTDQSSTAQKNVQLCLKKGPEAWYYDMVYVQESSKELVINFEDYADYVDSRNPSFLQPKVPAKTGQRNMVPRSRLQEMVDELMESSSWNTTTPSSKPSARSLPPMARLTPWFMDSQRSRGQSMDKPDPCGDFSESCDLHIDIGPDTPRLAPCCVLPPNTSNLSYEETRKSRPSSSSSRGETKHITNSRPSIVISGNGIVLGCGNDVEGLTSMTLVQAQTRAHCTEENM